MKAVVCKAYGPPEMLVVEDIAEPTPGAGEVVVEVKAAGVNFPDTLIIEGKYQFKPELPFSPGAEVAGVVTAVGESVTQYQPGDLVAGLCGWGGFAQKVAIPVEKLAPLPADLPFDLAATFLMAYGTSIHALQDRGRLQPGETLLVLGAAGGVGLAAVEIGAAMGARVIAAASSEEKLRVCRDHGAAETIDYSREDIRERIKALTGGKGVDVIYDPVGAQLAEPTLRSMAWKGRYLVVGFAGGEIPRIPLNLTLLKGCDIAGVFWGEFVRREPQAHLANVKTLLGWLQQGKLRPLISGRYPLEGVAEALKQIVERKVVGKLVIVP